MGLAFAAGLLVCIAAGVLIAFGILSTSVAVAFLRRNPMSGLRALFIQIGAVAGAICGVSVVWLAPRLANIKWTVSPGLLIGAVAGLIFGALAGIVVNYAVSRATSQIVKRYHFGKEA
jgi:hypothetical protein